MIPRCFPFLPRGTATDVPLGAIIRGSGRSRTDVTTPRDHAEWLRASDSIRSSSPGVESHADYDRSRSADRGKGRIWKQIDRSSRFWSSKVYAFLVTMFQTLSRQCPRARGQDSILESYPCYIVLLIFAISISMHISNVHTLAQWSKFLQQKAFRRRPCLQPPARKSWWFRCVWHFPGWDSRSASP